MKELTDAKLREHFINGTLPPGFPLQLKDFHGTMVKIGDICCWADEQGNPALDELSTWEVIYKNRKFCKRYLNGEYDAENHIIDATGDKVFPSSVILKSAFEFIGHICLECGERMKNHPTDGRKSYTHNKYLRASDVINRTSKFKKAAIDFKVSEEELTVYFFCETTPIKLNLT